MHLGLISIPVNMPGIVGNVDCCRRGVHFLRLAFSDIVVNIRWNGGVVAAGDFRSFRHIPGTSHMKINLYYTE